LLPSAFPSTFFALFAILSQDASALTGADQFFRGYDTTVAVVVALQAFGGVIVAVVIKSADNIAKGFASAFSIVVSSVVSCLVFQDLSPDWHFLCGALVVVSSIVLYGRGMAGASMRPRQEDDVKVEGQRDDVCEEGELRSLQETIY